MMLTGTGVRAMVQPKQKQAIPKIQSDCQKNMLLNVFG